MRLSWKSATMTDMLGMSLRTLKQKLSQKEWEVCGDDYYIVRRLWIGTVFGVMPSGKYYMPWTTNQNQKDEQADGSFLERLEGMLNRAGCGLENGEGDPCDMYVVEYRDKQEAQDEPED